MLTTYFARLLPLFWIIEDSYLARVLLTVIGACVGALVAHGLVGLVFCVAGSWAGYSIAEKPGRVFWLVVDTVTFPLMVWRRRHAVATAIHEYLLVSG